MKRISNFLSMHWFGICLALIFLLSFVLRFSNYPNRWGLAYDQAHDVIIAKYALETHSVPLLGPFSSAGAFQTGGEWYWFIMVGFLLFPFGIMSPWIFLTFVQVLFPLLMVYLGYKLVGRGFGLIVGLLSAISPDGISQAVNLTNQSPLNLISAGLLVVTVLFFKKPKTIYLFWIGLLSTLGATMHLQGVPLVIISFGVFLLSSFARRKWLALVVGGIIPLIPLIYFDATHHFINIHNMLQYYFHDQYAVSLDVLGRNWKTYLGNIIPPLWGGAIGGVWWLGALLALATCVIFFWLLYKRQFSKPLALFFFVFFFSLFLIRYTRTPIFNSYIMFLHPFIFLFSSLFCYLLLKKWKFIGIAVLLVVVGFSLQLDITNILRATNTMKTYVTTWERTLVMKYPHQRITLYDYEYRSTGESMPLLFYLQYHHLISSNGHNIGFGLPPNPKDERSGYFYTKHLIQENKIGFYLIDLASSSSAQLSNDGWAKISPQSVYQATEQWYTNK